MTNETMPTKITAVPKSFKVAMIDGQFMHQSYAITDYVAGISFPQSRVAEITVAGMGDLVKFPKTPFCGSGDP